MLKQICELAIDAGSAIMAIYTAQEPLQVEHKSDDSPVTAADIAAHNIIAAGLTRITPNIPQLSEEAPPSWDERKSWQRYWLIDPLDGTKEFIQRNGDFTVNIALIENGTPVMGVVYAPAKGLLYYAEGGQAWKKEGGNIQQIHVNDVTPPVIVISRSHQDHELLDYLAQMGTHETVVIGSSLKFCWVAEGKAQLYPRFGPTNTWDTAAGHAIAIAAGAKVLDWNGKTLDYTPKESFLNPGFRVTLF
ncbi:3'(2'),5'-bisphosphate nucleotidase CysQ [Providencia burhodogranariea]|uniref:3'(2'),5'-bisphosphate nucleotidase CysQ n=1 Tax=Providencia burhodogranariea DSM 19968 TaxID=1141662 RepID=K8WY34_9GAMM|nr:3'(2'),5'-bisphosphate nucleotidase CysQ [Providencia burhodogranariea]EKT61130.1 adenosine-3'(2'),5'-bisphosphate nucleotidase [Providencia burhodogranariea DSM 19968]